jgi:N-acyl-D-aspartate/D-glutamate deacylase
MALRITRTDKEKGVSMPNYDLFVIRGQVVDGTGNPWFYGDVAIQGYCIAAITHPGEIAHD